MVKKTHPLTADDLIKFRKLLCADEDGDGKQRVALSLLLDKSSVSLWRYETGSTISDGLVMRLALVQLCAERDIPLPPALRYGRASK